MNLPVKESDFVLNGNTTLVSRCVEWLGIAVMALLMIGVCVFVFGLSMALIYAVTAWVFPSVSVGAFIVHYAGLVCLVVALGWYGQRKKEKVA